ncbi:MAG TPA: hypothetical protein VM934_12485 [Pyrinomonadaceae bacterium]|jgi:hypothetical protein|nr:hypothetical protein [Pyrinomonadaceae bacterium]
MDESRDRKSAETSSGGESPGAGHPKRDEEATSSETLSDVEESTKATSGGTSSTGSSSLEGSSPNPQTEGGGRADGSDSGGPM